MKKIFTLFFFAFLFLNDEIFAHPMGVDDKRVDINFECTREDRTEKFGFKKYKSKKDGSEIVFSLPFLNKSNQYGLPSSEVKNFGSLTHKGKKYDNYYIWFTHVGKKRDKVYLFKEMLLNQGNQYWLNRVFFKSTMSLNKELYNIDDNIGEEIDWDYEKTSNLLRDYYKKSFIYSNENPKDKYLGTRVYQCSTY